MIRRKLSVVRTQIRSIMLIQFIHLIKEDQGSLILHDVSYISYGQE